jgi:hypothetical protein
VHPQVWGAFEESVFVVSSEWGANFSGSSPYSTSCFELFSGKLSVGPRDLRAYPEHEMPIVKALQDLGSTVGVTGNGLNDSMVLRKLVSFRQDPVIMPLSEWT